MSRLVAFVVASAVVMIVSAAPALATDITNPADHPFPIAVTVYGQTYHDGLDTLPGYDDYACTAIPGVEYDFAHNEIEYPNGKVASWTEWDRIPGYDVWLQQQKTSQQKKPTSTGSGANSSAGSSSGSGSGSSSDSSTGSSSGSSSGANSGANLNAPTSSGGGKASGSFVVSKAGKARVSKVSGAFTVKPTTKKAGKYRVTVATPSGLVKATGTVTVKVKKGSTTKILKASLARGSVIAPVPHLGRGVWSIAVTWPGDAHYLAASARGSLAVT